MPRLGKIRLGVKIEGQGKSPYPKATDFFVCPPEVQDVFGEKPKELQIMFPTEEPEQFAQQWLRAYSLTQGLVCIGDGAISKRKIDLATGGIAGHETKDWEWRNGLPCDPQDCPEYIRKRCRRVMNLQFLIPQVEGLGVWQIDTSSFYSIVNINSMIKLVKNLCGRVSFIPLTLCLGPIEVTPPGMTKKTVHVMHINQDIKLAELQQWGQREPTKALLPEPDVDEPPEDLFPNEIINSEPTDLFGNVDGDADAELVSLRTELWELLTTKDGLNWFEDTAISFLKGRRANELGMDEVKSYLATARDMIASKNSNIGQPHML
jgi:hypothetical protein